MRPPPLTDIANRIRKLENAKRSGDGGSPQCPHSLRFAGQVLPCLDDDCANGCGRAKDFILARLALAVGSAFDHQG
jgi:hypothetical protein